ncbi:hypothetical protein GAMM_40025 [Gammaproteobacteria bacterium]
MINKINEKSLVSLKEASKYFSSTFDYDEIELADMFAIESYYLKIEDKFIPLKDFNLDSCWCDTARWNLRTDESMAYLFNYCSPEKNETKIDKLVCLDYNEEQILFPQDNAFTLIYYEKEKKWKVLYKNLLGQKVDILAEEITKTITTKHVYFSTYLARPTPNDINNNSEIYNGVLKELHFFLANKPQFISYKNIFIVQDDVAEMAKKATEDFNEADKNFVESIKEYCNGLRTKLQNSPVAAVKSFLNGEVLFQLCAPLLATYFFLEERLKGAKINVEEEEKKVELINNKLEYKFGTKLTGLKLEEIAEFVKENIEMFPIASQPILNSVLDKLIPHQREQYNFYKNHSERNVLLFKWLKTVAIMAESIKKTSETDESEKLSLSELESKYNLKKEKIFNILVKNKIPLFFKVDPELLKIERAFDCIKVNDEKHMEICGKLKKKSICYKLADLNPDGIETNYLKKLIDSECIDATIKTAAKCALDCSEDMFFSHKLRQAIDSNNEKEMLKLLAESNSASKPTTIYLEIPDEEDHDGVIRAYGYQVSLKNAKLTLDDIRVSEFEEKKLQSAINKQRKNERGEKEQEVIYQIIEKAFKGIIDDGKDVHTIKPKDVFSKLDSWFKEKNVNVKNTINKLSWSSKSGHILFINNSGKNDDITVKTFQNYVSKLKKIQKGKC